MSLLPLIEEQARLRQDAVAVVHGHFRVTYRQLADEAGSIATVLLKQGVQPGSLVAVYLSRSPRLIASLIAIWQAGAAYVPLDPTYPSERTAFMLQDSGAAFLLSETELLSSIPGSQARVLNLSELVTDASGLRDLNEFIPPANSIAYIIYTSGSTGRPKGALITHGSLANTIMGLQCDLQLQPSDVLLASNSVAFDVSGQEFYLPLVTGGRVHLVDCEVTADGHRLMHELRQAGITIMMGLSTSFRLLLAAGWQGDPTLQLAIGGETLSLELANSLAARSRVLWNCYGPTETSICATSERIEGHTDRITLGRPLKNVRVYVLDESRRPLPAGSVGEIYIGGAGVGAGYLNRPELTAKCFLRDPFDDQSGATMYKTGDFGAILEDGRIEFLGRADEQVKIRGFRIELGEVESALLDCPGVRAAVARALEFAADDKRLVAFLVCDEQLDRDALRAEMRLRLPYYMVPSEYIVLESFPLMPNGKIDRQALDGLRLRNAPIAATNTAATGVETEVMRIWQLLLRTRDVNPGDNFFDLGGHSLLAARMVVQIDKQLGMKIPVSILAQHPTLEKLADYIRGHAGQTPLVLKMQHGQGGVPLFLAHGIGGSLLTFRELVKHLGPDQAVYGLRMPVSLDEITSSQTEIEVGPLLIRKLAAKYVEGMRALVPSGPYQLAGHSSAALVVMEVANQLQQMGCEVCFLGLVDPDIRSTEEREKPWKSWKACKSYLQRAWAELKLAPKYGISGLVQRRFHYQKLKCQFWFVQRFQRFPLLYRNAFAAEGCLAVALYTFRPDCYPGEATLFVGQDEPRNHGDSSLGWEPYIAGSLDIVALPGGHDSVFDRPYVNLLAAHFSARLFQAVDSSDSGSPMHVHSARSVTDINEHIGARVE
jgi:amino acid adenylation domain-containing protein